MGYVAVGVSCVHLICVHLYTELPPPGTVQVQLLAQKELTSTKNYSCLPLSTVSVIRGQPGSENIKGKIPEIKDIQVLN